MKKFKGQRRFKDVKIAAELVREQRLRLLEGGGEGQQDASTSPEGRRRHQGQHLCPRGNVQALRTLLRPLQESRPEGQEPPTPHDRVATAGTTMLT